METNIVNTLEDGERVTSSYAEIYLDDEYCDYKKPKVDPEVHSPSTRRGVTPKDEAKDDWVSPSDLLIGILDLKPPFTSKITRGKTHEGILAIGDGVLKEEHDRFLKKLTNLLKDNDLSWMYVQEHEKDLIVKKVQDIYHKIFLSKSQIMQKEITEFYEKNLIDLEQYIQNEVKDVLLATNANLISDLNFEMQEKLQKERKILEEVLQKQYNSEVEKIQLYYKLLLRNEIYNNTKLVNNALHERNDALKAFCRQIEAENATSTMYVMCTERKKCRIKQFILENFQTTEIKEKIEKIKEKQKLIDAYKDQAVHIFDINKQWEEKVTKVLQLFLKFISFSLKLLPEQTTFLLDLEKMVVLQLNEIQKHTKKSPVILVEKDELLENLFNFEEPSTSETVCDKDPFVIEGDLATPIPTPYGSRETLPSHADLPMVRLQRQFIYAKCQKMEQVRAFLEAQRCKCRDMQVKPPSDESIASTNLDKEAMRAEEAKSEQETESSYEPMLIDDIKRLHSCPVRGCRDYLKEKPFPDFDSYVDFTEENFERVKVILGKLPEPDRAPDLVSAKEIAFRELQFEATKEPYHDVGTQYSSQEDLSLPIPECPCLGGQSESTITGKEALKESPSLDINLILEKRKNSLRQLMKEHPKLVEIFMDENYDFQL